MKENIVAFDYAGDICKALPGGILLTTKAHDQVNSMTIGWGHIGIEWGKPIFVAYVRKSRYTYEMLEENGEFTVNVPMGEFDKKILGYCGRVSGRDADKIADLGLTLEEGRSVSVPGIKELPLTLECRVIYKQEQNLDAVLPAVLDRYYPSDDNGVRDVHIAYYGEIVDAYLLK